MAAQALSPAHVSLELKRTGALGVHSCVSNRKACERGQAAPLSCEELCGAEELVVLGLEVLQGSGRLAAESTTCSLTGI
ncbi:hypothetical protein JZ751_025076 [Albula glossodonta]|uniref:Uncharacterized protein n=1 Tax=Albula glossodonta TaxID=121402 RepID=A0A8T2PHJ6_9TELE|nr:hypothetical protein JZ751_025076 [Albula glossodonta]